MDMNVLVPYFQKIKQMWGPDRWCTNTFARDAEGKMVSARDERAVQFCALGIVNHVVPAGNLHIFESILERKLREKYPDNLPPSNSIFRVVPHVNDHEDGKGYEKIMSVIDDILLEHAPAPVAERELVPAY